MNNILKNLLFLLTYLYLIYLIAYSIYSLYKTIKHSQKILKYQKNQTLSNQLNHDYYVPISLILITSNDEKRIMNMMNSLLNLNYKLYEIVIVDNGSMDKTCEILIQNFKLKKVNRPIRKIIETDEITGIYQSSSQKVNITLLTKGKSTKKDTKNAGINIAEYPYITFLNSSMTLPNDALENIVRPILEDDQTIICKGNILVGQIKTQNNQKVYQYPQKFISKIQTIQYAHNQCFYNEKSLERFILFKKELVLKEKGYKKNGETFELLETIINQNHQKLKIKNVPNAICFLDNEYQIIDYLKHQFQLNKAFKESKKESPLSLSYFFFTKISSYLSLIGLGSLFLLWKNHFIPIKDMILFFLSYIFFLSCLSYTSFLIQCSKEKIKLTPSTIFSAIFLSILENSIFRFLNLFTNLP